MKLSLYGGLSKEVLLVKLSIHKIRLGPFRFIYEFHEELISLVISWRD
jgi:mRNA-degrading endonuclease RelE of RelBE toxin-antitoxin system